MVSCTADARPLQSGDELKKQRAEKRCQLQSSRQALQGPRWRARRDGVGSLHGSKAGTWEQVLGSISSLQAAVSGAGMLDATLAKSGHDSIRALDTVEGLIDGIAVLADWISFDFVHAA